MIEIRLHTPIVSQPTMQFFAGNHLMKDNDLILIVFIYFNLTDEIHRRRQQRIRKERMETRRQQRAELFETQKLFSQCNCRNLENIDLMMIFISFRST